MVRFDNLSLAPYESDDPRNYTWLHLPKKAVPTLVTEYIAELVTSPTNKYCTCEWIVHPDDMQLPPGVKRRLRKGMTSWDCWIHTKEGMILGFFTWVFAQKPTELKPTGPHETMELPPGVRAKVDELYTLMVEDGAPYEEVMAYMQESSKPETPEQQREWEDQPEKQQAVAQALKDKFIEASANGQ